MKIFLAGATGATGKLLAETLLDRGHEVVTVVRSRQRLPEALRDHESLGIHDGSLLDLSEAELSKLSHGCSVFVSCLGHNLSLKGMFGPPYRLVTEVARRLCGTASGEASGRPARFILMSSAGIRNPDRGERVTLGERVVNFLLRILLPPHADNEAAAAFFRKGVGNNSNEIEWVAVRPDALVDEPAVSPYTLHLSPVRSAIFNSGKTSRINVASFMADLVEEDSLWEKWKGAMPVIYNGE